MMMLDRALRYAAHGWPVFPLLPGEKRPLVKSAHPPGTACKGECGLLGHGLYDATTSEATIRAWWGDDGEPAANIGLRAGIRWWVLDIDAKQPPGGVSGLEMVALLESMHGPLPPTLCVRTPGGGEHRYFRLPADRAIGNRAKIKTPDGRPTSLDVRGNGGYVVAEPSSVGGKAYALASRGSIAEAPAWLLDVVAPPRPEPARAPREIPRSRDATGTRYGAAALAGACRRIAESAQGDRHDAILHAALGMGSLVAGRAAGLSAEACEEALVAAGIAAGKPQREVVRTVRDGLARGAMSPRVADLADRRASPPPSSSRRPPPRDDGDDQPPLPGDGDMPPGVGGGDGDGGEATTSRERPKIVANRDRLLVVVESWSAILAANVPAALFVHGGNLALVRREKPGDPAVIAPASIADTGGVALRAAAYVARVRRGEEVASVPVDPPRFVVADLHANPHPSLPVLDALVRCPVFDRDRRLVATRGHDARSGLYYDPPSGFHVGEVPRSQEDAHLARQVVLEEWLGEFPFAADVDRAHALALFLLPFARRMIDGPTPLHLVEASERGTGKSLLAELLLAPSMGRFPDGAPLADEDDEVRKKLTASLVARPQAIYFDNLDGRVDSPSLCIALTCSRWEDRVLASSRNASVPVDCAWLATGNNADLSTDLARRTVRCRLDRGTERPWEYVPRRQGIRPWTLSHRAELVSAALCMVQSWIDAGARPGAASLGSYEAWSATMGGILEHAGQRGFLANAREMYDMADPAQVEWRQMVVEWWHAHGTARVSAGALAKLADDHEMLNALLATATGDRAKVIRIGRALGRQRGRIFHGLRLERHDDPHANATTWSLAVAEESAVPAPRDPPAPYHRRAAWHGD
ncbi:MAG: bifunctional DNA primase/polymerase [Deltaproteobacteria bacterium]|nr:bifunctional DNA primase/polymerase [Deltaproteobacteria bacterium]